MSVLKGLVAAIGLGLLSQQAQAASFSFVALGDTAYNGQRDYAPYEALIRDINKERPAFTIHVGDIWGASNCHDEHYEEVRGFFDQYTAPLVLTPGDNEWIDCENPAMGGYDPLERLAKLRALYFSKPQSLGKRPMTLVREADVSPHTDMVENLRWEHRGVLFMTLNVPGPDNGFVIENMARLDEAYLRNKANVAWLRDGMRIAHESDMKAVVIAFHAEILGNTDMRSGNAFAMRNGPFGSLIRELQLASDRFEGQILVIHGDSHKFVVDRPFLEMRGEDTPSRYDNLLRLEVFGAPDIGAVRIDVDTGSEAVFSFKPILRSASSGGE